MKEDQRIIELEKLLRQARDEIQLLTEGEDCDHSVGICCCGTKQLLNDIGVAVGEICADCNGDGFQYVEEEIGTGQVQCATCGGTGKREQPEQNEAHVLPIPEKREEIETGHESLYRRAFDKLDGRQDLQGRGVTMEIFKKVYSPDDCRRILHHR